MSGFFEKFIFNQEAFSYIRMGLSLARQLRLPQKILTILIFGSPVCTPLIPCLYHWNGWRYWWQTHAETWIADSPAKLARWWGKRSQRQDHFIFRLNIVLHNSYQANKIVMEIEKWQQKVSGDYARSFNRALSIVFETLIVS